MAIGTSVLRDLATSGVILGIALAAGAWLAGTSARAGRVRRRVAPYLVAQPGISAALGGVVILLLLAWGPFPITRTFAGALVFVVVWAGGLFALRQAIVADETGGPATPTATPTPTG